MGRGGLVLLPEQRRCWGLDWFAANASRTRGAVPRQHEQLPSVAQAAIQARGLRSLPAKHAERAEHACAA